ncbi:adenylate cyclase [Cupriavidus sp. GA3-3]|uniref:class IV adenylate cyclase n=1 Tax=Cupriavidus sp. GA3-3 TaxID=1229514 RepID=UPI00032D87C7|nr:class IV adenylate cyclase [Cupriavidus sp. GA3-3]EON19239.1 adenylate cyclase [Cupriavidus sp. GA3-3]
MPRNVEIKARIDSIEAVLPHAAALADSGPEYIRQDDTFFPCVNGRLKLREFAPDRGELIFYARADEAGPKESFYILSPTRSPDTLRAALAAAHGEGGRVRKLRTLYLAGRTRVHLDRVEDLGDFLELEVVLAEDERLENGVAEAHALLARLGIPASNLIEGAYVDLLRAAQATRADTGA